MSSSLSVDQADSPALGGYATGRATKADIVDAAFHVFNESGYVGTSVREIARRAGINHATLLHHFPKKSDLLQAVLEHRDELQHIDPSDLAELFALLLGLAIRNDQHPGPVRLFTLLAAEASEPSHPAHAYFQRRTDQLRAQIAHHIGQAQAAGAVASDLDPTMAATQLIALWEGLQLQAPLTNGAVVVADYLRLAFENLLGRPVEPVFLD